MSGSTDSYEMRQAWYQATSDLPYGVQHVFHDVLSLVKEGMKTDLVYGADYRGDGGACLVNSASSMLVVGGGAGVPMAEFSDVVSQFDAICSMLCDQGFNTEDYVSADAAGVLLQWFGPLKEMPTPEQITLEKADAFSKGIPYIEPTDEEMLNSFETMLTSPSITPFDTPVEIPRPFVEAEFAKVNANEITVNPDDPTPFD